MKRLALFALFAALCLGAAQLPQASLTQPADGPQMVNLVNETAGVVAVRPMISIPHCGDYCSTPGAGRGCIDDSGPFWKKVPCQCLGGTWTCGYF